MAPFPESESMTIKRLEVAIRKKDMHLLKDGAYKLHEKFHTGHKFEFISQLEQIYEYVKNHDIPEEIKDMVALKLELVGLGGFQNYYPAEISGGMKKRAGLARALALDPQIVFFDEPSAGLDPISSKNLDDLILQIKENLHTTIVMVTHELPSIFAIGTNSIYLDVQTKTVIAHGNPNDLLKNPPNKTIEHFLTRGKK